MEVPPEDEVVEEVVTVVQELQEERLEGTWAEGGHLARVHRGERSLVCIRIRLGCFTITVRNVSFCSRGLCTVYFTD